MVKKRKNGNNIETAANKFYAGQFQPALEICKDILSHNKQDINALNLAGIISDKLNQKKAAVTFFKQAVDLAPHNLDIVHNLASTLIELHCADEAIPYLLHAVRIAPHKADFYFHLGNAHQIKNEPEKAVEFYQVCIHKDPSHIRALNNLGSTLHKLNRVGEAENAYRAALAINHQFIDPKFGLACIVYENGDSDQAIEICNNIISQEPGHIPSYFLLAKMANSNNQPLKVINYLQQIINKKPGHADAVSMLANIFFKNREWNKAKTIIEASLASNNDNALLHHLYAIALLNLDRYSRAALQHLIISNDLKPNQADVLLSLGKTYHHLSNYTKALQYLEQCNQLSPDNWDCFNTIGVVYHEMGDVNKAIEFYKKSIDLNPEYLEAHNNLGNVYKEIHENQLAIGEFNLALAIDDRSLSAINNLALTQLLIQNFEDGWKNYRYRPSLPPKNIPVCQSRYADDLTGQHFNFIQDQGIGDELFFLRFIPDVIRRGAKVSYYASEKLYQVLSNSPLFESIYAGLPDDVSSDTIYSVGDLPYLLHHSSEKDFPAPLELSVDQKLKGDIQQKLIQLGDPPYFGITWRSGGLQNNKRVGSYYKEIPLEKLTPALKEISGSVICLQGDANEDELQFLNESFDMPVLNMENYYSDLPRQLALLSILDDYISVSNTNIHLREGCRRKSHVLVATPPEWRWLAAGEKSQWFPHCHIYRQDKDKSWDHAIHRLTKDIKELYSDA